MTTLRSFRSRSFFVNAWILLASGVLAAPARGDEPAQSGGPVRFASIVVKGEFPEGATASGIFGELEPHLIDLQRRLDRAGKDEHLTGVLLQIRNPGIGLGKVNELRGAIAKLRKAGKKVIADLQSASTRDYLLATACDEIVLTPPGELMITGLRAEVMFYKKLFDKLGVQADFIQVGDFKGAAEPYTRTEMSPEFRQQYESVIADFYQQIVQQVATDRKLEPAAVETLIDQGLITAGAAKEAKLVDRVCYEDELLDQLKAEYKTSSLNIERGYGKQKVDTDFSGIGGIVKLVEIFTGVDTSKARSGNDKIAVVYCVGAIMSGESGGSLFGESVLGGDTIARAIRTADADEKVKAIVLRVDSPGGSALASDLIWREVVRAKKPVIASMGDVAASGGYYVSMGAKKIFVEPGTLTGSIGVVGGKIAMRGLMDKVGLTTEVISRGKNSGVMASNDPFTPSEKEAWRKMMDEIYQQFTSKAATGRKMELARLGNLAAGRVFSGKQAVENGLADQIGTLFDAVIEAKSMAGIPSEQKVELLMLPESKSFLDQLFSNEGDAEARLVPGLGSLWQTAQTIERLFAEPAVLMLPARVQIR